MKAVRAFLTFLLAFDFVDSFDCFSGLDKAISIKFERFNKVSFEMPETSTVNRVT